MRPDRIVIGVADARAEQIMRALYAPIQRNHERMIVMDILSAELTKYAANAMLATRISFMNELANLAEKLGADIEHVRQGSARTRASATISCTRLRLRRRVFSQGHIRAAADVREAGMEPRILDAVSQVNQAQKSRLIEKITRRFGDDLSGKRFAVWGLAYKPNTDDMREATSRIVVPGLVERGATVVAYDPVAMEQAQRVFSKLPGIGYADSPQAALDGADCLVIITEWKEFRSPDFDDIKRRLRTPVIIDGRNSLIRHGAQLRPRVFWHRQSVALQ